MRVTSDFFVSALRRRVESAGAFALVLEKGAESAGAIYIISLKRTGHADLVGPAPQSFFEDRPDDRQFEYLLRDADETSIRERLTREKKFDPDIWVLEIEDSENRLFVDMIDSDQ